MNNRKILKGQYINWGTSNCSKSKKFRTMSDTNIEALPLIPKIKKITKRCILDLALNIISNFSIKAKIFITMIILTTLEI